MREIPLTQGYTALIDDQNYALVSRFKWSAQVVVRSDGAKRVYAVRSIRGKNGAPFRFIQMHKFISGYARTDHKDGNGINNQRENLRPANHSQNGANRKKRLGGSSVFLGVCWLKTKRKWQAAITKDYIHRYIGCFDDENDAALAYNLVAFELFGEFARFNTPDMRVAA